MGSKRKVVHGLVLLTMILSVAACSDNSAQSNEPIKATWIEPQVVGDTVSIPISKVENNKIIHFKLATLDGDMAFMAYELDGEIYVRSNICPPCRSVAFSLQKDTLVCDTCKTTFKAKAGDGSEGAWVDFPKASVPYEIKYSNLAMKSADLIAAYQDTMEAGWP